MHYNCHASLFIIGRILEYMRFIVRYENRSMRSMIDTIILQSYYDRHDKAMTQGSTWVFKKQNCYFLYFTGLPLSVEFIHPNSMKESMGDLLRNLINCSGSTCDDGRVRETGSDHLK